MKDFKSYVEKVKIENIYKVNIKRHETLLDLFVEQINESKETSKVIDIIKKQGLEQVKPEVFKQSMSKSKHKEMLSDYSTIELNKMKLFKVPGYNIGYALKLDSDGIDIVCVHNNEPSVKGVGKLIMKDAIKNGGNKLDHFDIKPLTDLYTSLGFKEYQRYNYDPHYDPDRSFANKYGELDVVYRKLTN